MITWEAIDKDGTTLRAKVHGGWLVKATYVADSFFNIPYNNNGYSSTAYSTLQTKSISMAFIADEFHKWDVR